MDKWIIILLIILIFTLPAKADFNAPFSDFGPNSANQIFTDTSQFQGILGASNTTVQTSLQTLSQLSSTVTAILQCETTDNFCFVYETNVLKLYVNGSVQAQWPAVAAFDHLLLEDGTSFLLLEDGVSKLRLE